MDIPLLPSVFAGYLPTVDLDAAVAELAPRLVAYATGRTGCRSTGEDVAQDALTALVVRWKRHGPPESPEAFAFAIARRRAGRAVLRRALTRPLEFVLAAQADANGSDAYRAARRAADGDGDDEAPALGRSRGAVAPRRRRVVVERDCGRDTLVRRCRQNAAASCSVEADRAAEGVARCAMRIV